MSLLRTAVALALIHIAAAQKNPYVDATNTYVDLTNLVNYTIPSSDCASPSSYETCVYPVTTEFANCLKAGGDEGEVQDCASAATKLTLQCIYANCWNIVYSCEVQQYAALFLYVHGSYKIPYYPAPDSTSAGSCSCNIEAAELAATSAFFGLSSCASAAESLDGIYACACCARAGAYATLHDTCPGVNPQYLLNYLPGLEIRLRNLLLPISSPLNLGARQDNCAQYLQQYSCESALNFYELGGSLTYLSTLPTSTGTATWSNNPGELATPSAEVVTFVPNYILSSSTLLATAVSAERDGREGGAATTTSAGGSPSRSETGSAVGPTSTSEGRGAATITTAGASPSGSGSAATPTSTSGAKGGPTMPLMAVWAFIRAVCYVN